jgi:hypothetical protein
MAARSLRDGALLALAEIGLSVAEIAEIGARDVIRACHAGKIRAAIAVRRQGLRAKCIVIVPGVAAEAILEHLAEGPESWLAADKGGRLSRAGIRWILESYRLPPPAEPQTLQKEVR